MDFFFIYLLIVEKKIFFEIVSFFSKVYWAFGNLKIFQMRCDQNCQKNFSKNSKLILWGVEKILVEPTKVVIIFDFT